MAKLHVPAAKVPCLAERIRNEAFMCTCAEMRKQRRAHQRPLNSGMADFQKARAANMACLLMLGAARNETTTRANQTSGFLGFGAGILGFGVGLEFLGCRALGI